MNTTPRFLRASVFALGLAGAAAPLWGQAAAPTPAPAAAPTAANAVLEDRWYVLQLDGAKAGSMQEKITRTAEGNLATEQEIRFALARAGTKLDISMKTGFVETPEGKPVSMALDQNLGLVRIQSDFTFTDDGVIEKTRQGEVERTVKHPKIEGPWLTPRQVEKLVREKLAGTEESFTFRSVAPTAGARAFDTKVKVLERGVKAEAFGKSVPGVKWETEASAMPGVTNTEWVDLGGRPVRSEVEIAGMRLQMLLSDEQVAKSAFTAPEAMAQTAIVPTGHFPVPPRQTMSTLFTIKRKDGQKIEGFPVGGLQRPTDRYDGTYFTKFDVSWPVSMMPLPADTPYLKATTACNAEDPEIVALATKAVEGITSNFERAKRLRVAVRDHIQKKNLGVGFATASEVVRTREGDCTEHAVLLAAALRAVKIPSRVVSGVIYTEEFEGMRNVFVYHMWTQAFVQRGGADGQMENNWIDMDATLPGEMYCDAARIGLSTSDLSDTGTLNSMVALSDLIGNLEIHVEIAE